MDEAALGTLVDALEFGAETFAPKQRRLIAASLTDPDCWWVRRDDERVAGNAKATTNPNGLKSTSLLACIQELKPEPSATASQRSAVARDH